MTVSQNDILTSILNFRNRNGKQNVQLFTTQFYLLVSACVLTKTDSQTVRRQRGWQLQPSSCLESLMCDEAYSSALDYDNCYYRC